MSCLIDTHCHLDAEQFSGGLDSVLENASAANVGAIVAIGMHEQSWSRTAQLSAEWPNLVRSVGMHPLWVAERWNSRSEAELRAAIDACDVVAIGETGLDFYRDADSAQIQIQAFETHLGLCKELALSVIIHQRNSMDAILEILRSYAPVRGVMHCFTGDTKQARACVDLGLHLGIGGILTFPSAGDLREAMKHVPSDRIVLETDAPFLAPQPWRGKRNEPAYVSAVADTLAEVRGESLEDVTRTTTANAITLFGECLRDAIGDTMEE